MQFKPVDPINDAALLLDIDNKVFTRSFDIPSKDIDEQKTYLKDASVYLVANEDSPVGFYAYTTQDDYIQIKTMALLPTYQGKGIGKQMMDHLLKNINKILVKLVTHPQNTQAMIFYLKSGFTITDWIDDYFGDGEPRIKMELDNT